MKKDEAELVDDSKQAKIIEKTKKIIERSKQVIENSLKNRIYLSL
jgi:hypothetical protein